MARSPQVEKDKKRRNEFRRTENHHRILKANSINQHLP